MEDIKFRGEMVTKEEWKKFRELGPYLKVGKVDVNKKFNVNDSTEQSLIKALYMANKIKSKIENEDSELYEYSRIVKDAKENSGSFGLAIDNDYYGRGISIVDGEKFLSFIRRVTPKDVKQNKEVKFMFKQLLVNLNMLYKYILEDSFKDFQNKKFDKFDELSKYRDSIKKEYTRLGMEQDIRNFNLSGPVNAYKKGYLRAYLSCKRLMGLSGSEPMKNTKTNASLVLFDSKNKVFEKISEVISRAKEESVKPEAYKLIERTLDNFIVVLEEKESEKYYGISKEEILQLLEKLKSTKDDIRNSV